ncbi:hypothetical protein ACJX0J_028927, partial [Zea mays]
VISFILLSIYYIEKKSIYGLIVIHVQISTSDIKKRKQHSRRSEGKKKLKEKKGKTKHHHVFFFLGPFSAEPHMKVMYL